MIEYAVAKGRPDWKRYWAGVSNDEYKAIVALRRIKRIAHEQEDWRAALLQVAVVQSMAGKDFDAEEYLRNALALIEHRDPEDEWIPPKEAAKRMRAKKLGNVR